MGIKIITKPFGEIEVVENQIIDFPEGILGFDYVKKFALLDSDKVNNPFKWLQAYDEPSLAFVVIRPVDFLFEYELSVPQADIEAVGVKSVSELLVYAIVTIPAVNPTEMTANLQGPVLINPVRRLGRQAISTSDRYTVRHRIIDELKNSSQAGVK